MLNLICDSCSITGCGPVHCLHAALSEFSSEAFAIQRLLTEAYHRDVAARLQHQVRFWWSCCSICCL